MIALFFVILFIPYAILFSVMDHAYQNSAIRFGIRKDILVAMAGAAYVFILMDQWVLVKDGFNALLSISTVLSDGGGGVFALLLMCYVSVQFIKIGFLNRRGDLNIFKFIIFSSMMIGAFIYSAAHINMLVLGYQPFALLAMFVGVMSCVFVSGLHTIFSRQILIVNAIGAIISIMNTGTITKDEFFIILKLFPKLPHAYGMAVVAISTVSAAYSLGIERGLIKPAAIFSR